MSEAPFLPFSALSDDQLMRMYDENVRVSQRERNTPETIAVLDARRFDIVSALSKRGWVLRPFNAAEPFVRRSPQDPSPAPGAPTPAEPHDVPCASNEASAGEVLGTHEPACNERCGEGGHYLTADDREWIAAMILDAAAEPDTGDAARLIEARIETLIRRKVQQG